MKQKVGDILKITEDILLNDGRIYFKKDSIVEVVSIYKDESGMYVRVSEFEVLYLTVHDPFIIVKEMRDEKIDDLLND